MCLILRQAPKRLWRDSTITKTASRRRRRRSRSRRRRDRLDQLPPPPHVTPSSSSSSSPPDATLVANASHLDDIESSDEVRDISSFQDIELSPPNDPFPNDDGNRSTCASVVEGNDYRLAKEHYYLLPYVRKYKVWILGCALALGNVSSVPRHRTQRERDEERTTAQRR